MKEHASIPRLLHAFFRWYCRAELYEEMHGDLEELYYERLAEKGRFRASLLYAWDVLRCFQPYAWKISESSSGSSLILIKNYYKTSWRNLIKSPLTSFINVFGLSAAIGVCLFGYGFERWAHSIDQFHENKEQIYLTTVFIDHDGARQQNGRTPLPLGEMLLADLPQVTNVCRLNDYGVVVRYRDKVFHEHIRLVDASFLELFTFPLKWGLSSSLEDPSSIILSEEMAIKYFGAENPVGTELQVKLNEQTTKSFTIAGVAKTFPSAIDLSFDFLINFSNLQVADPNMDDRDWSRSIDATIVEVQDAEQLAAVQEHMEKYKKLQQAVEHDRKIDSFEFVRWDGLHYKSGDIVDDISYGSESNLIAVRFIYAVAFFLLVLACFNYVNIAIVSAARRLKEIGLRKTIGARRKTVIVQFLAENLLITLFALVLGVAFGSLVVIPWFEMLNGFTMEFTLNDWNLWIFLLAVVFFTAIVSGFYPALYISRFQVTQIFRGAVQFGRKGKLTQLLLGFQLILAFLFISVALMFAQNNSYLIDRAWGYDQQDLIYAHLHEPDAFEQLKAALLSDPNVLEVSGSANHIGIGPEKVIVQRPDRQFEIDRLLVDATYLSTMGVELKEGRFFESDFEAEQQNVIVNERLVKHLSLEESIEATFTIDSLQYTVVGVIQDFHQAHFDHEIQPLLISLGSNDSHRFAVVRTRSGEAYEAYKSLQRTWNELYPDTPFQGGYQHDVWGRYFEQNEVYEKVWWGLSGIAIILAGLGLYGLVTLNVAGRVREFSIRRVLGAGSSSVGKVILRQYFLMFGIVLVVGTPASYYLLKFIMDLAYAYHKPIGSTSQVVSFIILITVLIVVVLVQVHRIGKSNPVNGLKVE